ncbi:MAG: HlyC/CorC family transporter [Anaerolineae bacterium]|nr:HlyC/CorC family transporter [Anaerolineae bacterium]
MEPTDSTAGIFGFVALLALNAVLSGTLASLVNVRRPVLRDMAEAGHRRAERVLRLAEDSKPLLVSGQFLSVVVRFLAAGIWTLAVGVPLAESAVRSGGDPNTSRALILVGVWLLGAAIMFIFAEQIPEALASAYPERVSIAFSGPAWLLLKVLRPISMLMLGISNRLATAVGAKENPPYVTEEEIKTLVDAGSEEGVIEDEEKEMIYSIFQFGDKVAREVMVPRIDIVAFDAGTPIPIALDTVLEAGHSRIPVYEGTIDRIQGVLYAKDLLKLWREENSTTRTDSAARTVGDVVRPAYFVPESKRAGDLLAELQLRKVHMAIVIDEFGGTAGLVTIEDLLEEIVGEIQDEYDPDEEAEFVKVADGEYVFDGGIDLDDVNEMMDVELSTEESDTLGGYVLSEMGRVPQVGERLEAEGVELTVEAITGRRIRKVRARKLSPAVEQNGKNAAPANHTSANDAPRAANGDRDRDEDRAANGSAGRQEKQES